MITAIICHLLLILLLTFYFWAGLNVFIFISRSSSTKKLAAGGMIFQLLSYGTQVCILMSFPFTLLNVMGLVLLNPFSDPPKAIIGFDVPTICFRVVTRGLYPQLVKDTTLHNIEICRRNGLKDFKFEIVTDKAVSLGELFNIREIVVPEQYKTANNALYKARALHYCLEPHVNVLSNEDWIVHLDEETKLTNNAIYGISNFVKKSNADIGQGAIVYADDIIVNWIITLLDGIRVAFDYGVMRLALQVFKRPIFGLKGSFIVAKVKTEIDVGFDFGPQECIAEDLRFALTAWHKSYKFGFIDGVMVEKSTFTILDFIKQRKRWFTGHFHILWGNSVPFYCKVGLLPVHIVNLFMWVQVLNTLVSPFYQLVPIKDYLYIISFMCPSVLFCYLFGNYMSFRGRRFSVTQKLLISFCSQILMPISGILEAVASLWGFFTRNKITFHIVEKQSNQPLGEAGVV